MPESRYSGRELEGQRGYKGPKWLAHGVRRLFDRYRAWRESRRDDGD